MVTCYQHNGLNRALCAATENYSQIPENLSVRRLHWNCFSWSDGTVDGGDKAFLKRTHKISVILFPLQSPRSELCY